MDNSLNDELCKLIDMSGRPEVGLAAHRLATGEEILIAADKAFHPASTIKICVMMEVVRQARLGIFSLDDPILIANRFSSLADGSQYSLDANDDSEKELYRQLGQSIPRRELVRRMITVSSNLATNILIEQVQPAEVTEFMHQLGAQDVVVRRGVEDKAAYRLGLNNSATARGLMQILLRLARHEVVSPEDSDAMIEILTQEEFKEMIPAGLPSNVRVAHKTGWAADHYHDVGIVFGTRGGTFVLSILTKGFAENAAQSAHAYVASLAKTIYNYWNPDRL